LRQKTEGLTPTQSGDGSVDGLSLREKYFTILAHRSNAALDPQQPRAPPQFDNI
jgi:hypothetical protein